MEPARTERSARGPKKIEAIRKTVILIEGSKSLRAELVRAAQGKGAPRRLRLAENICKRRFSLHAYKYSPKTLYGITVLEGSVKVRGVYHYLNWKVAKTPKWASEGP